MPQYGPPSNPEMSFYLRLIDHITGQAVEVVGTAESFEVSGYGSNLPSAEGPPWSAVMRKMKVNGFLIAIEPNVLPDRTLRGVQFPSANEIASGHAAS